MASNEIMNDAELDNVVGGSGIECIAFLSRLQAEGLYTPKTPLAQGNEAAAAKELQAYLSKFSRTDGSRIVALRFDIRSDGESNTYSIYRSNGAISLNEPLNADQLIDTLKHW